MLWRRFGKPHAMSLIDKKHRPRDCREAAAAHREQPAGGGEQLYWKFTGTWRFSRS
jgi:hypothetical protein